MNWEEKFQSWARPPGQTEQQKCENAVRGVQKAIEASTALNCRNVTVLPQGSYHNRTSVRIESDVDVGVVCTDSFFYDLPQGKTPSDFGFTTPAAYSYPEFKDHVHSALASYFGGNSVTPRSKVFDIHANSYRVEADVVPCFEYHRYDSYDSSGINSVGTAFLTSAGTRIINWPEQNYENGVAKNEATGKRFKALVRILKHLRNEMEEANIPEAKPIGSFLIECLAWNVPDQWMGQETLTKDVRSALAYLLVSTQEFESCKEWGEINELKYLFRSAQPWTLAQVNAFMVAAWIYLRFE